MNVEDTDAVIRSMDAGIGYEKLKPSQMQAVGAFLQGTFS